MSDKPVIKRKKKLSAVPLVVFLLFLCVTLFWAYYQYRNRPVYVTPPLSSGQVSQTSQIDPSLFEELTLSQEDLHKGDLILVNPRHAYVFPEKEGYLTPIYGNKNLSYKVKDSELSLNTPTLQALNEMMTAFEEETGLHDIIILSAYRSIAQQESIYQQKIEEKGEENAGLWAALPGYSEHHTGYAVDLGIYTDQGRSVGFSGQGKYSFITANAFRYGFILRYEGDKTSLTGTADRAVAFSLCRARACLCYGPKRLLPGRIHRLSAWVFLCRKPSYPHRF